MPDMSPPCPSPVRPVPGVSAAIFRDNKVLLVKRAQGLLRGLWSLPGGHIEPGEKAVDAIRREIHEETNIEAEIKGLVDTIDVILRDQAGQLEAHYVLSVFCGLWRAGEAAPGGDSAAVKWLAPTGLVMLKATEGLAEIVNLASQKLQNER